MSIFPVSIKTNLVEAIATPSTTTLTMTTGKDTASVSLTPTSSTGTFATSDSANEAAFTVTTNNLTGYSLNLIGSGSDTTGRLVNNDDSTYYLDTLTSDVDETTFRTGNAATYNNKWGYKLTINGATNTNYLAAPTATTKTIHTTTTPNTTTDSYTLGIGVRADYNNPVGTYTNTFVLTAVGNPVPYEINYLDNTGTGGTTGADVSNLPAAEASANSTIESFTLSATTPTRTGYSFIGWCYGTVTHVEDGASTCSAPAANSNDTGDGTIYQPGDSFTFSTLSSTTTNVANLYAMWNKPNYIQDFTRTMCSERAVDSSVTVVDRRDGNDYQARYINGNCWMVQNLRYVGDEGSSSTSMIMKADTSNIASDQTLTIGDLTSGDDYNNARIHVATADQVPSGATYTATDMGVWYNYAAASAGTITGSSNSTAATYDICPKGWRLPTNSEQSGIRSYKDAFSPVTGGHYYNGSVRLMGYGYWWSSTSRTSTNRYDLNYNGSSLGTGNYNRNYGLYVRCVRNASSVTITFNGNGATGGSMDTQVINGSGSSKPSGTLNANQFTNNSDKPFIGWNTAANGSGTSYADGATYTASTTGDTTVTLYAQWFDGPTMQDFTASMCPSSNSIQVMDARDGNLYTVRYINGNCWMTQNLRFTGTSLSSTTSNVASNYTDASPYQVNSGNGYTDLTSGSTYDEARIHVATSDQVPSGATYTATDMGVWYNYAAASAGTITGSSNSTAATYDICPKGWRLPTNSEQSGIASYGYDTAFSPVTGGGYYGGGTVSGTGSGYWWSSTAYDTTYRYYLDYNGSTLYASSHFNRYYGGYVRCVRNASSVTITFNGNGATGGSMDTQVINGSGSSKPSGTLNANQFTNGDKVFTGWNTQPNGSGTSYTDGATYTASTTGDTTVTLYAQWFDGSTVQDLTKTTCQTLASSQSIQAVDARDGNLYTVRYINGNCWMVQNLRYLGDRGSTSGSMVMKAATSNIDTDKTLAYTSLTTTPYNDYDNAKIQNSGNTTNGVWYNYAAASAGTITGYSNSTAATYDICPKGWRLPTNSEQSGIAGYTTAFSPVTGGYYYNGTVNSTGGGCWWSSKADDTTDRYYMFYNGSSLNTSSLTRYYGLYVRCVRSS